MKLSISATIRRYLEYRAFRLGLIGLQCILASLKMWVPRAILLFAACTRFQQPQRRNFKLSAEIYNRPTEVSSNRYNKH